MLTRNKKLLILFAIILSFFIFRKELFQDKQNAVPQEDEVHHESPIKRKVSTHKFFKFFILFAFAYIREFILFLNFLPATIPISIWNVRLNLSLILITFLSNRYISTILST